MASTPPPHRISQILEHDAKQGERLGRQVPFEEVSRNFPAPLIKEATAVTL